jgi:hypothetical protein
MIPSSWDRSACRALSCLGLLAVAVIAGCSQGDARGTYDVEIEVAGLQAPLAGILVLSTAPLDIPSGDGGTSDREWLGSDPTDANSCLILYSSASASTAPESVPTPESVHVFSLWMGPRNVELPIEIALSPVHRIEITKLQFFANAIGGDLVLRDQEHERPGRIHGLRSGPPYGEQCVDELEAYKNRIRGLAL